MEQKEILEGNRLIAEFMGDKVECRPNEQSPSKSAWYYVSNEWNGFLSYAKSQEEADQYWIDVAKNFQHHKSWDWLMPVVEKIQKDYLNFGSLNESYSDSYGTAVWVNFDGINWHAFHYWRADALAAVLKEENDEAAKFGEVITDHKRTICSSKIEATWLAVVQFITWYNSQPHAD